MEGERVSPKRIQLRRTKGWRKPDGVVVVSRPTRWGNPFRVGVPVTPESEGWAEVAPKFAEWIPGRGMQDFTPVDRAEAVAMFRVYVQRKVWTHGMTEHARHELAGHDLACWCPLSAPCHADVLLELANA